MDTIDIADFKTLTVNARETQVQIVSYGGRVKDVVNEQIIVGGLLAVLRGANGCTIIGGDGSHIVGKDWCFLKGGFESFIEGGENCILMGGCESTLMAGIGSKLCFEYFDGEKGGLSVAFVGQDGILADVAYVCDRFGTISQR